MIASPAEGESPLRNVHDPQRSGGKSPKKSDAVPDNLGLTEMGRRTWAHLAAAEDAGDEGWPGGFQPLPAAGDSQRLGRYTADPKSTSGNTLPPGSAIVPVSPITPVTLPPTTPNDPSQPGAFPPPAPAPGHGWDPERANGVSAKDIDRSLWSAPSLLHKRVVLASGSAEKANELQKHADLAAKFRRERGTELETPTDDYFASGKAKVNQPELATGRNVAETSNSFANRFGARRTLRCRLLLLCGSSRHLDRHPLCWRTRPTRLIPCFGNRSSCCPPMARPC